MKKPMTTRWMTMTAVAAMVASLGLAGCGQRDRSQADSGTVSDQSMARADRAPGQTDSNMDRAKDATRDAAQDAKDATSEAGAKISDKVGDAVITTTVKAELAKDSTLSAMKINVDTDSGRVMLRGTAPSALARDHATQLAAAVKGVVSVDNQLTVEAGKG